MNFLKGWNKTMSEILIGSTSDPNEATVLPETPEQKAKQLPDPSGYRIFCGIPEIQDSYDNGLIKSDITMKHEELLTTVFLLSRWVLIVTRTKIDSPLGHGASRVTLFWFVPTQATRVKIHGREFRIINDDAVEGVVQDPRGISRA
jgi:hypothetical protein